MHEAASAALARATGEQRTLVKALSMLGYVVMWLGEGEMADALLKEALQFANTTNDKSVIAEIKALQSTQEVRLHGDFVSAWAHAEEAVRLLRDLGNPWDAAISIFGMGAMATFQGSYSQALAYYEEGEMLFRQLGDRNMVNAMQSERAHIERRQGHYAQAMALYSKTLSGWQELGNRAALAHELECFAFIASAQNQTQRAAHLLGVAEALRESIDSPMPAHERVEYDQNVSAMRAQMDAQAFGVAWTEGRAMTMEQAIQFALEWGKQIYVKRPS